MRQIRPRRRPSLFDHELADIDNAFNNLLSPAPPNGRTTKSPTRSKMAATTPPGPLEADVRSCINSLRRQLRHHARTPAQVFFASDADRTDTLSFREFVRGMSMMGADMPSDALARRVFNSFDLDHNGQQAQARAGAAAGQPRHARSRRPRHTPTRPTPRRATRRAHGQATSPSRS